MVLTPKADRWPDYLLTAEPRGGGTKVRDEAVTERNLAALALAKAELEHKMAQVGLEETCARLDRRSILSPINGVVSDVTIRLGEYVYEQTPLMTIAEINPLYVEVFVPVRHYLNLRVVTDAEVMPEESIGGYKAGHRRRSCLRHGKQHLWGTP